MFPTFEVQNPEFSEAELEQPLWTIAVQLRERQRVLLGIDGLGKHLFIEERCCRRNGLAQERPAVAVDLEAIETMSRAWQR